MKLNILGTEYTVIEKKYADDEVFECRSIDGYCDGFCKEIVLCDMHTCPGWEHEEDRAIEIVRRETLRHEIVHAFLNESGLMDNACTIEGSWAKNEEMIDWIAVQGPKIWSAWCEAGAIHG